MLVWEGSLRAEEEQGPVLNAEDGQREFEEPGSVQTQT